MEKNTACIALCNCKEGRRPFGIRFEKEDNSWVATWAFALKNDKSAQRERYDDTKITGNVRFGVDYPGCPYCGSKGLIVCGSCGALNCNLNSQNGVFTCGWCGMAGELTGYEGEGIAASGDR